MFQRQECTLMFHVEKMQAADFPFAVELANTMNWSMTTEDFVFNVKLEPAGCFVLFDDHERVGIATSISYGRVGWFGNLVVAEAYREKGAGTLLVEHAVNYLKSVGVEAIGLYAYPHLLGFYGKFGFKLDVDFLVLKAEKVSSVDEGKLEKVEKQNLPALSNFDGRCFGASRKKLLEQILLGKGNLCYVSMEESEVVGYVAAKVSGGLAEVGPLVCRGSRRETATDLLKAVLAKLNGTEAFMYLPASEKNLVETAVNTGFQEQFRLVRMFLGSHAAEECVYIAESLERG